MSELLKSSIHKMGFMMVGMDGNFDFKLSGMGTYKVTLKNNGDESYSVQDTYFQNEKTKKEIMTKLIYLKEVERINLIF